MKQDGEVEVREEDERRVFYVDVGDISPKEALRVINEIRKKQGMPAVSRSWVNWVLVGIAVLAACGVAYTVVPLILPLLG